MRMPLPLMPHLMRLPANCPRLHAPRSSGPPVPEFLVKGVTQEQARQVADAALPVVNKALGGCGVP